MSTKVIERESSAPEREYRKVRHIWAFPYEVALCGSRDKSQYAGIPYSGARDDRCVVCLDLCESWRGR